MDFSKIVELANSKIERRPFNIAGRKDSNFNYVHQCDILDLIELAYKEGRNSKELGEENSDIVQQLKAKIVCLLKSDISGDDVYAVGWNSAINTVIKQLSAV